MPAFPDKRSGRKKEESLWRTNCRRASPRQLSDISNIFVIKVVRGHGCDGSSEIDLCAPSSVISDGPVPLCVEGQKKGKKRAKAAHWTADAGRDGVARLFFGADVVQRKCPLIPGSLIS